jgi:hypothetical protein
VWEFRVGARSAAVSTAWGSTLDINGDGYADAIVGADMANTAYVYLGSAMGLRTPTTTLRHPTGSTCFGFSVASAGDVNGDGLADAIADAQPDPGHVSVFAGGTGGIATAPMPVLAAPPTGGSAGYGRALAGAGDINRDGYDDILVSAQFSGVVYVYLGTSSGLGTTPDGTLLAPSGGLFGISVARASTVVAPTLELARSRHPRRRLGDVGWPRAGNRPGPPDLPTNAFCCVI